MCVELVQLVQAPGRDACCVSLEHRLSYVHGARVVLCLLG